MALIDPPYRFDPLQMPVNINWGAAPGGDYVLINFNVPTVPGDYHASSPTGSTMSWVLDPTNGTECALTVAITQLFPGAKIVYQNTSLIITPHTSWWVFLDPGATNVFTEVPLGPCSGSTFNHDECYAWLTANSLLPADNTHQIGYHTAVTGPATGGGPYSSAADAAAEEDSLNAGGPGSVGAAAGYSAPDNTTNFPSGPWTCFDVSCYWQPYYTTTGTFYEADFKVTYVIQLPFSVESPPPPPEIPAFAIHTTGYPWSAEISIYPRQGIALDPSPPDPTFPLAWEHGPPLGPDGNPFAPFGTPSVNVKDAFLWKVNYEDQAGTAAATEYPFAIVVADHLTSDPPPDPMVRNSILQLYPTFVSTLTYLGDGSGWTVDGYADVPYGRSFYASAWGDNFMTVPGPPPLIAVDVPA